MRIRVWKLCRMHNPSGELTKYPNTKKQEATKRNE